VVRAWDLGSSPVALVGYAFECTKHLAGMGPVSLVPDGHGQRNFSLLPLGHLVCPPACNSGVPMRFWAVRRDVPVSLVPRLYV
jgi:hypothetical protein